MLTHHRRFSGNPAIEAGPGGALDCSQTCVHYSLQPVLKQCLFSKEYISGRVKIIQLSQAAPASPRTASALKEGSSLTSLWSALSPVEAGPSGQWGADPARAPTRGSEPLPCPRERRGGRPSPAWPRQPPRLSAPATLSRVHVGSLSQRWGHKAQRGWGTEQRPATAAPCYQF